MAKNTWTPSVALSKDILLGHGKIFKDLDQITETELGPTMGGCKYKAGRTLKLIEYDGAYGPKKGMQKVEVWKPQLILNMLKIDYLNSFYGIPHTVTDGTDVNGNTYKKVILRLNWLSTDILTNLAFVGEKHDGSPITIYLYRAMDITPTISYEFGEKGEIKTERTFEGAYASTTPITPPFQINQTNPT
jgi:hypothetical protein